MISSGKAPNAVDLYNESLLFYNKEIGVIKRGRKTIRKVVAKNIDSEGWLAVINEKGHEEILSPGDTIIEET